MKTAAVIWLLALVVAVGLVLMVDSYIDGNNEKSGQNGLYGFEIEPIELDLQAIYGSEALEWAQPEKLIPVVNNYGAQVTADSKIAQGSL